MTVDWLAIFLLGGFGWSCFLLGLHLGGQSAPDRWFEGWKAHEATTKPRIEFYEREFADRLRSRYHDLGEGRR